MKNFSIAKIWNDSLEAEQREVKPREHINASDIGMPFLDRYYKMKGVKPTNPFDDRALRVFAAGNEFHHLMRKVFEKIGILQDSEFWVEIPKTDSTLKVVGKCDSRIGGFSDWEEAKNRVKLYGFSEAVEEAALKIIDTIKKNYPKGLQSILTEIKSVHSNAFWAKKDYLGEIYPHHKLQLYTYLKGTNEKEGRVFYISKDDLSLVEHRIFYPNEIIEEEWQEDIETMTKYYQNNQEPPKESDAVYDDKHKKWKVNWRIERSNYCDKIVGTPREEWLIKVKSQIKERNKRQKKEAK